MAPIIIGVVCFLWLLCALVLLGINISEQKKWNRKINHEDIERDVHDGSNLITGAVIALVLGPIGLVFYAMERRNKQM